MPSTASVQSAITPRQIIRRTRGHGQGITRLMSPSDLGGLLKPFVFLDLIDLPKGATPPPLESGWHPHSGIATISVLFDGSFIYAETTGNTGELTAGGVEWMQAGAGVWHTGTGDGHEPTRGFQLWIALPADREHAPSYSQYLKPSEVPQRGPARVVLGQHEDAKSPIDAPPMNYLAVHLKDGERWVYQPPSGHNVAWASVLNGQLHTPTPIMAGELAVFEESEGAIEFMARGDARFVLGSAPKHPHELVLGSYSVHTNAEALRRGEDELRRLGRELSAAGKRSYALGRLG